MISDWQDLLLRRDDTIRRAIEVIDRGAKRIALVVDEAGRLLGTVTDGDVRRGILRHLGLDAPVAEVMNPQPRVLRPGYGREEALRLLGSAQVLQVPIVGEGGVLVGLETLTDLLKRPRLENPVFLMAGGFGTRLRPLTDDCPKPMLPVGGRPMLEHILQDLVDYGFYRFYISVHYLREKVIQHFQDGSRWGVTIQYVHEDTPLGTAGALGLLPKEAVQRPLIVVNGDIMTRVNYEALLQDHDRHTPAATVCTRQYDFQVPYGVIEHDEQRITDIIEKPVHHFFVSAGIYVLAPQVVHAVEPNVRLDMPDLLKRQIKSGREVRMFPVHEYWLDIGRVGDFELAQRDAPRVIDHG
ncbi:UTP--glucose-1-phosphate uridylyltransferase [Tepidimonas sediminis]|uniref:UTP--glucose-1-phosphate uridylyltransferase n=1 Tax=Tepidimonas sediminis TaxID=2588941 RepID=A0A554WS03_9BURK|nr:nucleotidyltransferase family protein [Tepidimonas sediminis]TSE26344.1 UTP--glucose-1-phosphate uridylyltransferase [Tepidimonas sediminis]